MKIEHIFTINFFIIPTVIYSKSWIFNQGAFPVTSLLFCWGRWGVVISWDKLSTYTIKED